MVVQLSHEHVVERHVMGALDMMQGQSQGLFPQGGAALRDKQQSVQPPQPCVAAAQHFKVLKLNNY